MTPQPTTLIAIDETKFQALVDEVAALRRSIEQVEMSPRPEWVTVSEYSKMRGKTTKTIRNWIRDGKVESRREGAVTMVKVA